MNRCPFDRFNFAIGPENLDAGDPVDLPSDKAAGNDAAVTRCDLWARLDRCGIGQPNNLQFSNVQRQSLASLDAVGLDPIERPNQFSVNNTATVALDRKRDFRPCRLLRIGQRIVKLPRLRIPCRNASTQWNLLNRNINLADCYWQHPKLPLV